MDDDIARAIALSLQEAKKQKQPAVIDLTSDDDEEPVAIDPDAQFTADLQRAIEASQAEPQTRPTNLNLKRVATTSPEPSSNGSLASTFLSERAQMEKERRERQKRLRREAGLEVQDDDDGRPAKRQHLSSSSRLRYGDSGSSSPPSSPPPEAMRNTKNIAPKVETINQVFWEGELRQTATRHAEPRKDGRPTFRLTEVLGPKSDIAFAIISSFASDVPWMYQFFDPSTPVILVGQPDVTGQPDLKIILPNWIKTTPKLRAGHGCMHMKLFHKNGRLRVVVSTANLIAYDWRDMENSVWLQDIPLRENPIPHDKKATEDFAAVLQYTLQSIHVVPALKAMLMERPNIPISKIEDLRMRWDWSKVKVHLIPSIAGKHEGWPGVIRTGHPRLMKAVRSIGMRTGKTPSAKPLILECQGSSLGAYTTQWMNEFHWSARGESAEDWLKHSKKRRESQPYPPCKILFPTLATVQESGNGEVGGGTLFCRRRQWSAKNYPKDRFYNTKSKAGAVLMHSKMILATIKQTPAGAKKGRESDTESDTDDEIQEVQPALGWLYIGSHNFTPSAWGTLSGSDFNPILNVTNYELGVMFPLKSEQELNTLPCWERPAKKYVLGKDEPWIQDESAFIQAQNS
ncbi:phospholipase D/nuclease [Pluteus cervinus]|uniref:Phospholipase D/nuclease n=1 Tax=Pluteus cervinus TaxID=181527 RepID=A0ACD3B412_9AGAR|nr:phospholipase D/nuclease [Pluteus cervinus]